MAVANGILGDDNIIIILALIPVIAATEPAVWFVTDSVLNGKTTDKLENQNAEPSDYQFLACIQPMRRPKIFLDPTPN